jgi:hypothetical protein
MNEYILYKEYNFRRLQKNQVSSKSSTKVCCNNHTVGTESIRTAERISRENAFFKTLPKIEFSMEFDKNFSKG